MSPDPAAHPASALRRWLPRMGLAGAGLAALASLTALGGWGPLSGREAWLLLVAGIAGGLFLAALAGPWRLAGFFAALFLAGSAAQLYLTVPIWFVYLDRPESLRETLALGLIALEGLVAALYLAPRALSGGRQILAAFGVIRLGALALLMALAAFSFQRYIVGAGAAAFVFQMAIMAACLAAHLLALIAFMRSLPGDALAAAADRLGDLVSLPGARETTRPLDPFIACGAAGLAFALSLSLALFAFHGVPHVEDEVAYLLQARLLLAGGLTLDLPPGAPGAFAYYLLDTAGDRWSVVTMPGWPAVLALGEATGMTALVNPLLMGLSVLLAHALVRRHASMGLAHLVALLMAASPWAMQMGASLMPHAITLFLLLTAWLALSVARERGLVAGSCLSLLAGTALGLLFLTRPLEGLIAGALTGLWLLPQLRQLQGFARAGAYGLGCLLMGGLIFPFNMALTGEPLTTPVNSYVDREWGEGANRLGFGETIGPNEAWGALDPYPGHSLTEGLINLQHSLAALNMELFGLATGSLILIFAYFLWGRMTWLAGAMSVLAGLVILVHVFYWFSGSYYIGPRYWFLAFFPLVLIAAFGLKALGDRALLIVPDGAARFGMAGALLLLGGVVVFSGWRASYKFPDYNDFHADYARLLASGELGNALVLVQAPIDSEFGAALAHLDPTFRADRPVFARSLGAEADAKTIAAFPDRPVIIIEGRGPDNPRARIIERRD